MPCWGRAGAGDAVVMAEVAGLPGGRARGEGAEVGVMVEDEQEVVGDHLEARAGSRSCVATDVGTWATWPRTAPHQLLGRGKTRRAELWASGCSEAP